jgi:probable HAF family extracellular repeat protein
MNRLSAILHNHKMIGSFLFLAHLVAMSGHPAHAAITFPFDVDGSGVVNAVDVQIVINDALGIPAGFPVDADINNDGTADAVDVQLVINAALGIGVVLEEGFATGLPMAGPAPLTVQFNGEGSGAKEGPLQFLWDFGNGATSTEQNPLYTYPEGTLPGAYRPTLTITDNQGVPARATVPITVTVGEVADAGLVPPGVIVEVMVDAPSAFLHGASVAVPLAALSEPKVITIGEADGAPLVPFGTVPLVELGPEGTTFDAPVTVSVPLSAEVTNPEAIRVVAFDTDLGKWTDEGISNVFYVGGPDRTLTFDTTHFTFFATSATWTITNLGTLGGTQSFAFSINEAGDVVGFSYLFVSANNRHAFIWDSTNGMQDIGTLEKHSFAFGVNDANPVQVVGYSQQEGNTTNFKAFLWDSTNGIQDLGNLGGSSATARSINDSGEVAGFSTDGSEETRAFMWDSTNGMVNLGTLGGDNSFALGINNSGEIVGSTEPNPAQKQLPFTYNTTDGMSSLGTQSGADYGAALAINATDEATGEAELQTGPITAALWDSGGITDLGTLGGTDSVGYGINANTEIVGTSDMASGPTHAFGWDNDGGALMTDLNDLLPANSGWVLHQARDINDAGQIVGWGKFNGAFRAFLLEKD